MRLIVFALLSLAPIACGDGAEDEEDATADGSGGLLDLQPSPNLCATVDCEPHAHPCKANVCVPLTGECAEAPANEGAACDDGKFCNGTELCIEGECAFGVAHGVDDGVACTLDTCDEDNDAIIHVPDHSGCDDGSLCTGEETCDLVAGCVSEFDASHCDDGVFCNGEEGCDPATGCTEGAAPGLDDGVECTVDTCDEETQTILHTPDDMACDDDDVCTLTETCDAVEGCQTEGTQDCDDGVFCNGPELCDPATGCIAGTPPVLDDGLSCTIDACDEETDTVEHVPSDGACDDDLFCNGVEVCAADVGCTAGEPAAVDDGLACTLDGCDEATDTITHLPVDAACDPGHVCSPTQGCVPAGG